MRSLLPCRIIFLRTVILEFQSKPKATMNAQEPATLAPLRVLHFVTGGFSGGATQVAIALVNAARASSTMTPLLALRRKRHSPKERIAHLQRDGVPLALVAGWSHIATILHLVRVCKQFRPDILVAHGFSEHLWGRYAGLLAQVPHLVQVEHNTRERYTRWRLMQSRWLAQYTSRIVGCSEGVKLALLAQGLPASRITAIANGIALTPFAAAAAVDFATRDAALVMVARLSKQKDHATLIHALALLRARGLTPVLHLAGGGKPAHRKPLEQLANTLGLSEQVKFLGVIPNVPALLMQSQIAVLSTHYEGMPLALIEGMAAGCAVVASDVPGVREIIQDGVDGRLVAPKDPTALADALEALLNNPQLAAKLAVAARARALAEFSRERMHQGYERLFLDIAGRS
jgi:glycosyltransferase involved in cell wall biosynthesis